MDKPPSTITLLIKVLLTELWIMISGLLYRHVLLERVLSLELPREMPSTSFDEQVVDVIVHSLEEESEMPSRLFELHVLYVIVQLLEEER